MKEPSGGSLEQSSVICRAEVDRPLTPAVERLLQVRSGKFALIHSPNGPCHQAFSLADGSGTWIGELPILVWPSDAQSTVCAISPTSNFNRPQQVRFVSTHTHIASFKAIALAQMPSPG